ncbi:MAG: hypothetical protein AAGA08_09710 [Pseudomonadota bacterium]
MRCTIPVFLVILSACAQIQPERGDAISQAALNAPYPALVPIDGLLAKAEAGSTVEAQTDGFQARVARLKQRAAALSGRSIVDGASRLKLIEAANRNAARQPS